MRGSASGRNAWGGEFTRGSLLMVPNENRIWSRTATEATGQQRQSSHPNAQEQSFNSGSGVVCSSQSQLRLEGAVAGS